MRLRAFRGMHVKHLRSTGARFRRRGRTLRWSSLQAGYGPSAKSRLSVSDLWSLSQKVALAGQSEFLNPIAVFFEYPLASANVL